MKYTITVVIAAVLLINYTKAEDPWTPSPLCPFPSTDLVRFPYEGNCAKYWECYNGARYPMDCPAGLEFNAAESRCDTPTLANCDPDATIVYPTFSHSTVTTPSAAPTEDPGEVPECPFPSNELIFFPVTNNCSKYWECFQGNRYLMTCPGGLFWNIQYNYCDYPGNVDCSRATTTSSSTTTTPASNITTTPGDDLQCPLPGNEITFIPHPTECNLFYECFLGTKYLMGCSAGLYWNHLSNSCDYRENVDCDRVATPTTPSSSTSSSTTPSPTCVGQPDGSFLPHPTDCGKFYECVGGHAIEEQCPGDLHWNQNAHTCDYPENVPCNTFAKRISRH